MHKLNTRSGDEGEGSMTRGRTTQRTRRGVLNLHLSWRAGWRYGALALAVITLLGVTESRRTFASLVVDSSARSVRPFAFSLPGLVLRSHHTPLADISRERELLRSVEQGDLVHVDALLVAGASANSTDPQGWSPLMMAALHNHLTLIPKLQERGADLNARNAKGTTALMLAANNGHREIVRELLARGAKVNARAHDGWTALMYAAWKGHAAIAADLLRAGADSSLKDSQHWTACMYAAWQGHTVTVEAFLRPQHATALRATDRKQARRLADRQGHAEVVRLFDEMEKRG